jgi:hypothetical protein
VKTVSHFWKQQRSRWGLQNALTPLTPSFSAILSEARSNIVREQNPAINYPPRTKCVTHCAVHVRPPLTSIMYLRKKVGSEPIWKYEELPPAALIESLGTSGD